MFSCLDKSLTNKQKNTLEVVLFNLDVLNYYVLAK